MLKPDPKDPNFKELMKQYEKDPSSWGPGGPVGKGQAGASGPSRAEIEKELRPVIEAEIRANLPDVQEALLSKLSKKLREAVEAELAK